MPFPIMPSSSKTQHSNARDESKSSSPMEKLSNELIRLILDEIEPDSDKNVPVDRRQFLSVESFDAPAATVRGSQKDICSFRRVSRRFAQIGQPLIFTRVSGRLTKQGLQRLEQLAEWPHLAKHVKKFSYLVPFFYGPDDSTVPLTELRSAFGKDNVTKYRQKVQEQRQILALREDTRVLHKAMATFTSLQHVQLLRVQDEQDASLLAFMRRRVGPAYSIHLGWAAACSHGSQTIGSALLASQNITWSRFSSPMLSPSSAEFLNQWRPPSLSTLAERLTCLTLHFDDSTDLDLTMSELSGLFKIIFTTAKHMQAVHVGFPTHRPLTLPLEDVFHHVTWERLIAFGVQAWKLSAEEILDLALRHSARLKGLRLRDVLLREGSMWKDVLAGLKENMHELEWVSLRRIGYAKTFDELSMNAGTEIVDDLESDSADDSGDDQSSNADTAADTSEAEGHSTDGISVGEGSDSDDEHGAAAHEMDFPQFSSPMKASLPWCTCSFSGQQQSKEDLGDDGYAVSNTQRKQWERWVVRKCLVHDTY